MAPVTTAHEPSFSGSIPKFKRGAKRKDLNALKICTKTLSDRKQQKTTPMIANMSSYSEYIANMPFIATNNQIT